MKMLSRWIGWRYKTLTTIENANTAIQIKPMILITYKTIFKATSEWWKWKRKKPAAAATSHNCHVNNNSSGAIATVHRPINIFGMIYNETHLTAAHSLATTVVTLIGAVASTSHGLQRKQPYRKWQSNEKSKLSQSLLIKTVKCN